MLPDRLIPFREVDGAIVPRWLEPRDEPWLRELLAEAHACENLRVREAEPRIVDGTHRLARAHGVSRRVVEAAWHVERRRWQARVDAPVEPEHLRRVLFDLAAERSRDAAIATAAHELSIAEGQVESALFADREGERRLVAPEAASTPAELIQHVNRTLAEALVMRSSELCATVHAHARRLVGAARLHGLMILPEVSDGTTLIRVSGPLSLFRESVKYGRALASWLHALATTPGWRVSGEVRVMGRSLRLALDASAPIPRVQALSRATDSRLEARLARDLRRAGAEWRVERESGIVRIGHRLAFPDFALVSDRGRVLLEVVGFWTPEYLEAKAAMLRASTEPLILCVDARHAQGALRPAPRVLPFVRTIDARALLEACEAALTDAPARGQASSDAAVWRVRVSRSALVARYAVLAGASDQRWQEDVVGDLCQGDRVEVVDLGTHERFGPQLLLVGGTYLARARADPTRADTLHVNAIRARGAWSPRASAVLGGRLALAPAEHPGVPPGAPVALLFARAAEARSSAAPLAS